MNDLELIVEGSRGNDVCAGCGGYDISGTDIVKTGNLNIKHFVFKTGHNSQTQITYCNQCSQKIALFLLNTWLEE